MMSIEVTRIVPVMKTGNERESEDIWMVMRYHNQDEDEDDDDDY